MPRSGPVSGRWVLLATVLGSAMVMIDGTVVNVALPNIGADLGSGFGGLQWTINAYTLSLASLILLGGSFGDHFGRRRVFLIGVVWFAVASVACGLAPNTEALIAARALQGVGGALLTPGSLALISASFRGPDRAAAIGAWSGLGGIAGAIGPFVGGFLVEWSWRAVFLINVPLAAVVITVTALHVPESRDDESPPGLDAAGAVLTAVGLGTLTYGLTRWGNDGADTVVAVAVCAGVLALSAFVVVERWSPHPLIPPRLFSDSTFRVANIITLLIYGALGAAFLLLVLQLQTVAGFSPVAAGTALLPFTLVMLLFSARAGAWSARIGPRVPMTVGPLIAGAGLMLMSRIGPDASWLVDVLPAALVFGAGMVLVVAPLTTAVLDAAPQSMAGSASGVNNAVARVGGLLAVAVLPGIAGISGADYADPAAFDRGFRLAVTIAAALMVLASATAAVGMRRRPDPVHHEDRIRIDECRHCAINGPPMHPAETHDQ
ncbi:MFS transporter [Mycolicibacterium chubuense]|uniref:Multidrug resistance protein stp n=1 Tax=Mycolicibacterium chubuense TaxID=1800 RepID=A0A0J6VT32_MYCCU|nr:MFS transporter [Mycolicibacterium chubuense]KMO72612.1 Multidrug resistance protein stp [Mycolicibacterium chubuense]SPX99313.1 drug resistance transporter, EmrB/QacA subfamily [Mycolicibacterium chubuense]